MWQLYIHLNNLISDGSDNIVISEHWLWPFELHRLNEIHPDYCGHGLADSRLTSSSEGRGYGGVGIIWRRDLDVSVVHATTSDRLCSIRLAHQSSGSTLTAIGVYHPCQDLGIDLYRSCLTELEQLVCESMQLGPIAVMGDFNAHLGNLGGPKGEGSPNQQGLLLQEQIIKNDLFVASLSELAHGPHHTFQSGDVRTIIDYIIMLDVNAASLMVIMSCGTLEDDDLNTSDHLPQSVQLEFSCKPNNVPILGNRIDWSSVESSCALDTYQSEINDLVTPFLGRCHESIDSLNDEMEMIANNIKLSAEMILPTIRSSKKGTKSKFFNDSTLKHLPVCQHSKSAWKEWCDAGRPQSGPLLQTKRDRIYAGRSRNVSTSVQPLMRGSVPGKENRCLGRKTTGVSGHPTGERLDAQNFV